MDRETILNDILSLPNNNVLCEFGTGVGKSRIAIELVKKYNPKEVLVVIPKVVLKKNWMDEFNKWHQGYEGSIRFITYVSLPKLKEQSFEFIIFDEAHHLSERCREALCSIDSKHNVLLSATIKDSFKDELREVFDNLKCCKLSIKEAIDNDILPDPKIILIPISLDNIRANCELKLNPKSKRKPIYIDYKDKWSIAKAADKKTANYIIKCTQRQYYNEISSKIDWYKKKVYIEYMKNKWLHACGERLRWLGNIKVDITKSILMQLKDERTLTFCGSIEQTELLGKYCINSKNSLSLEYLEWFNKGKINHITAANILNEGANLVNCRIGIYNNLNSSETIVAQRLGRILRHKNPIIIIPYFISTREEELVEKMMENYNKDLVVKLTSITKLKDIIK